MRLRSLPDATHVLAALTVGLVVFTAWEAILYGLAQHSPFPEDPFFDLYEENYP